MSEKGSENQNCEIFMRGRERVRDKLPLIWEKHQIMLLRTQDRLRSGSATTWQNVELVLAVYISPLIRRDVIFSLIDKATNSPAI